MNVLAEKAKSLFAAAVEEHAPAEWDAFLDERCTGDLELRSRVKQLLAAHVGHDSLLDVQPAATAAVLREPIGQIIGPYKLLEQIGEGGMGVVYMAQQARPVKRKVALKIIKPGMNSKAVVARFEAERQALALMDHANIAHVLEGGTTEDGRPYFVMELVRGIAITDYCEREKLDLTARLKLFLDVCRAVQHAHLKAIIHRDLKPSNVLVTLHDGEPVVKVIDFGVAKALNQELTERTLFTQFSQMVGTPLYMSPEQADISGLDIDTRADIYSLGVLLYELITGTTPFDKERLKSAGFDEMRRIIREEEPDTVSTRLVKTRKAATGFSRASGSTGNPTNRLTLSSGPNLERRFNELDWIVAKALDKDRNRRYETASGFAADVQRFLDDEPVLACPPSTLYRLKKWTRRFRGTLVAMSAVALALIAGTGVATWQAFRATQAQVLADAHLKEVDRQRQQAQIHLQAANQARELADKRLAEVERERTLAQQNFDTALAGVDRMLSQVGTQKGSLPLPEPTRRVLLADALKLYDRLVEQRGDSIEARKWAAETSTRVAELWEQIGERQAAHRARLKAVEIYEQLAEEEPTPAVRANLGWAIHGLAWFSQHSLKDFERAAELFRREGDIQEKLAQEGADEAARNEHVSQQLNAMNGLVAALKAAGRSDEALVTNLDVLRLATPERHNQPLADALKFRANMIADQDPHEAWSLYERAVDIGRQRVSQATGQGSKFVRSHFARRLEEAAQFFASRNSERSIAMLVESGSLLKQLAHDYPGDTDFAKRHISVLEQHAGVLRVRVKEVQTDEEGTQKHAELLAEAEGLVNEAASIQRRLAAADSQNPNRHALVDIMVDEARSLRRAAARMANDDPHAAEHLKIADRQFREAMAALRERADASSEPAHRERLIPLLREQALFIRQQAASPPGKAGPEQAAANEARAVGLLQEAAASAKSLDAEYPENTSYRRMLVDCQFALSSSVDAQVAAMAEAALRELAQQQPTDVHCHDLLCQVLLRAGKHLEVWKELDALIASHAAAPAADRAAHFAMRAGVLAAQGKCDLAVEDYSRAITLDPGQLQYYENRGGLYEQLGNDDAALTDYTSFLNQRPTSHKVLQARGEVYLRKQQYDLAEADYRAFLSGNPRAFWIRKRIASIEMRRGDYAVALKNLNQAIEEKPEDLTNITWMPLAEIAKSHDAEFRTKFLALVDHVVDLNSASAGALLARAVVFAQLGFEERSREDMLRAVASEGELRFHIYYQGALLALHHGDRDTYRTFCRRMLVQFADSKSLAEQRYTVWTCALAPAVLDDYAPAVRMARECVPPIGEKRQMAWGLGAVLYRAGLYASAIESYERALAAQSDPHTSPVYDQYFLAMAHQRLGQTEQAQRWLQSAIQARQTKIEKSDTIDLWYLKKTLDLLHAEATALVTGSGSNP